jgi:hypothetical protein
MALRCGSVGRVEDILVVATVIGEFCSNLQSGSEDGFKKQSTLKQAGAFIIISTNSTAAILSPYEAGAWTQLPQRGSQAYLRDRHYSHIAYQNVYLVVVKHVDAIHCSMVSNESSDRSKPHIASINLSGSSPKLTSPMYPNLPRPNLRKAAYATFAEPPV